MKIAAITRYKNGALWEALQKVNWSQSHLAEILNTDARTIGQICNLQRVPSMELQVKIAEALLTAGCVLDIEAAWPPGLQALDRSNVVVQMAEVDQFRLGQYRQQQLLLNSPGASDCIPDFAWEQIDAFVSLLPDRLREVVEEHFLHNRSLMDIGGAKVTGTTIRHRVNQALRKLRRAMRKAKKLEASGVLPACYSEEWYQCFGWLADMSWDSEKNYDPDCTTEDRRERRRQITRFLAEHPELWRHKPRYIAEDACVRALCAAGLKAERGRTWLGYENHVAEAESLLAGQQSHQTIKNHGNDHQETQIPTDHRPAPTAGTVG